MTLWRLILLPFWRYSVHNVLFEGTLIVDTSPILGKKKPPAFPLEEGEHRGSLP
nr:MAG TPA: hypothetical protein [Caudoviricetes sp.]